MNPQKSGFSIIEVLVSLLLIAIIISVFMSLFFNIFKGIVLSQKKGKEIYKSQQIIENVIANPSSTSSVSIISTTPVVFTFGTTTVAATGEVITDGATNFYIFISK